jgi:hypothetical protein
MRQNTILFYALFVLVLFTTTGCVKLNCPLPENLNNSTITKIPLSSTSAATDLKRNSWSMGDLCANRISFYDKGQKWTLLLVRNTKQPQGPFWYLPHDNENSALDAAVYATNKYGGGFLSIEAFGNRYASGKDPNRQFKRSSKYTKNIFKIIDTFKRKEMPYLTLHSNKDGHEHYGGDGTVSMRISSSRTKAYPSGKIKIGRKKGLKDEDNLIYLAGRKIDKQKIKALNNIGIHVKYELVTNASNDNSMSNYIALYKRHSGYINIEAESSDTSTQKKMIDRVMKLIYQGSL